MTVAHPGESGTHGHLPTHAVPHQTHFTEGQIVRCAKHIPCHRQVGHITILRAVPVVQQIHQTNLRLMMRTIDYGCAQKPPKCFSPVYYTNLWTDSSSFASSQIGRAQTKHFDFVHHHRHWRLWWWKGPRLLLADSVPSEQPDASVRNVRA